MNRQDDLARAIETLTIRDIGGVALSGTPEQAAGRPSRSRWQHGPSI
jgi:hypothetical protein